VARPGLVGGQYQPLTQEQIERIHRASLAVLENTGVHVENARALALYGQGGATVDGNRVFIPALMGERFLASDLGWPRP
jgi:trimethylamine--corrinoid protein Co-methyltransferase